MTFSPSCLRGRYVSQGLVVTAFVAAILLCACASFQGTAGKVLVSTVQTVDAAMTGYGALVASDVVPAAQQLKVRAYYSRYQAAVRSATNAYMHLVQNGDKTGWTAVAGELAAAQTDLLQAIKPKVAP